MNIRFLHEDAEFGELLLAVAQQHPHRIGPALIEKDYRVTHALWALQAQGFELWFKGGTSLSKGFGLVQRCCRTRPGFVGSCVRAFEGLAKRRRRQSSGKAALRASARDIAGEARGALTALRARER